MRHLPLLCLLSFVLLAATCTDRRPEAVREQVDSLNERAFTFRYKQIDSLRDLASEALRLATEADYPNGMAEAMNNLMFERFQQMDFDSVVRLVGEVQRLSAGKTEQLVCDIMQMRVDQRTSDNRSFFVHRSHALRCLADLEDSRRLSAHQRRRLDYARSDLHIVASTYFYYVDQRERAIDEIRLAEPSSQLPQDTAQWLYYCYMRGSGGLAESSDPDDVTREEFDYLLQCFSLARYGGYPFFEANSTQSLASMFADPVRRACLRESRPERVHYLTGIFGTDSTAANMAEWALTLFTDYDDLYQSACALRTIGELCFDAGEYLEAIDAYAAALDCVNLHHDLYYAADSILEGSNQGLLQPYDPSPEGESVERRWLKDEGVRTVPEWIAGIRERLSVAYSALGMKTVSDYNRNIYLDLLEVTREDAELTSRAAELRAESRHLRHMGIVVALVALGVVLLAVWLFLSWRRRAEAERRQLSRQMQQCLDENERRNASLAEEQEQLQEQQQATEFRLQRDKRLNVEKHAKLSLVHAIVPFLDRIIHEVRRMTRAGETNEASLQYIRELLEPIEDYNRLLTEWIHVEQGQLSLQLSSFPLEPLFAAMRKSHFVYEQKGLTLSVEETDLSVKADRTLTLFMLNTLADNARKFTPSGGRVSIRARAGESAEGAYVELSVQDTGIGMTPSDIDLILHNKVYDASTIGVSPTNPKTTQPSTAAANPTSANPYGLEPEPLRVRAGTLKGSAVNPYGFSAEGLKASCSHPSDLSAEGQKGFGFGLMNCKGIIEKYRKTNPLFRVCNFSIESRVGEGSRFSFRLPRVVTSLLLTLLLLSPSFSALAFASSSSSPSSSTAASSPVSGSMAAESPLHAAYPLMDSLYYCNIQGRYADALFFAAQVIAVFNASDLEGHMELRPLSGDVAETLWWQQQQPLDYQLLLALRNEVAVAALALNDWSLYRANNRVYKRLYKLVGQDTTLEAYCQQTERAQRSDRLLLMAIVVLFLIGLVLVFVFWFRPLVARRRASVARSEQHLESVRAEQEAEHRRSQEDIELAEDEHRRRLYEEERLHVQNQIIDNCLSTIKHETMYYPGRIRQLAERQPVDLQTLSETVSYYKDIYTLLAAQADSQSAAVAFRRSPLSFATLVEGLPARFATKARRRHLDLAPLHIEDNTHGARFIADPDLVLQLLDCLLEYELSIAPSAEASSPSQPPLPSQPSSPSESSSPSSSLSPSSRSVSGGMAAGALSFSASLDGRFLRISLSNPAAPLTAAQLHNLFMPHDGGIPLLICKQIIREHDTFMGHPGCRITAEPSAQGHVLWFTLPLTG